VKQAPRTNPKNPAQTQRTPQKRKAQLLKTFWRRCWHEYRAESVEERFVSVLQGYSAHLASTIMEWILAGSFLTYFFTFIRDFQVISIRFEACLHHTTLYHVGGDQLREEEEDGRVQMQ